MSTAQVDLTPPARSITATDRAFTALFFGSYKLPIAACTVLKAADIGIRSMVTGFWLAMLTPRMIERLDHWYYSRGFQMYLDPGYNRSGWFDWEKPVIDTYFAGLRKVLIAAGAGAGREMLALNRMGVGTVGYEHNAALRELGNRLLLEDGWQPKLRAAPSSGMPEDDDVYDGVIIGWASYSLMPGRATRVSFLKSVRRRCREGAPLLVSYLDRTGDRTFYRLSTAVANSIRRVLRRTALELGDTLSASYAHYFAEEEIHAELAEAGFLPVSSARVPYACVVATAETTSATQAA